MKDQEFPEDYPQEEESVSEAPRNAPPVNVASKNWKEGLALGKLPPMPAKDWKKKIGLVNIAPMSPKKEKEKNTPKAIERKTPIAPIGKRKIERLKNEGSEVDVFRHIWETREHTCDICKNPVKGAFLGKSLIKPQCFPHILSKGLYPSWRLEIANIGLVCSIECHNDIDRLYSEPAKRREFENFLLRNL